MPRRSEVILRIGSLVGEDVIRVIEARNGWPGLAEIRLPSGTHTLAIHAGTIGRTHRGRDDVERRFQNPSQRKPVSWPSEAIPLLIGLWEDGERPVLVGMEVEQRQGRSTRQSLFVPLKTLLRAASGGWAQHYSASGELIVAFHPRLLPAYIDMRRSEILLEEAAVSSIIKTSGLLKSEEIEDGAARARRATLALVRNKAFSRKVRHAYDDMCAMCGLDLELVEGAHIYPVQAPDSTDNVWNGLALCPNHHSAFDKHQIWVSPESLRMYLHPNILERSESTRANRQFVKSTRARIRIPKERSIAPRPNMFTLRYRFFGQEYSWFDKQLAI